MSAADEPLTIDIADGPSPGAGSCSASYVNTTPSPLVGQKVEAPTPDWIRPVYSSSPAATSTRFDYLGAIAALWNGALRRCILLNRLSRPELDFVLSATRPIPTKPGEVLFTKGDLPTYCYLVARGRYRATVEPTQGGHSVTAREYGPMENFGGAEMLCRLGVRASTLEVLEGGLVWGIPMRVVTQKLAIPPPIHIPGLFDHAMSVKLFRGLTLAQLSQVCRCAKRVDLSPQACLCRQGDPARAIYTILHGSIFTSIEGSDFSITLGAPESLGESALAAEDEQRVRSSSVFAGDRGATVLIWPVSCLETVVGFELQAESLALQHRKLIERATCGSGVPSLAKNLSRNQVDLLIHTMERRMWQPKEVVVAEGTFDEALFVIHAGEAGVRKAQGSKVDVAKLKAGDVFGESCLLSTDAMKRTRRKTSIVNTGATPLVTFSISLEAMDALEFMSEWRETLNTEVGANGTAGVDGIVVERVVQSGGNVASITAAAARPNAKSESSERGKKKSTNGGSSERGGKAPAPAPDETASQGSNGTGDSVPKAPKRKTKQRRKS